MKRSPVRSDGRPATVADRTSIRAVLLREAS